MSLLSRTQQPRRQTEAKIKNQANELNLIYFYRRRLQRVQPTNPFVFLSPTLKNSPSWVFHQPLYTVSCIGLSFLASSRRLHVYTVSVSDSVCCAMIVVVIVVGWKNRHRWTSLPGAPVVMRRLVKSFSRFQNVKLAGGVMSIVANLAGFPRLSADVTDVLMNTFL